MAAFWPASSWPVTFVACSGGFENMVYAFGFGYGLSMMANAGLTAVIARHKHKAVTPFGLACCGLYALYGLRLTTYELRRNSEPSYAPRLESLQLKSDMMGLGPKFAIVAGVSFAQALYALPLAIATSPTAARARPLLRGLGWAGVGISAAGLLLEHLADEQKLAGKRADPKGPVMDGLYSYLKHPNYFGEILFHCGISCMGISGTPMQVFACIFPTFFMAFTLQNAARRSDREADHKYKRIDGYAEWSTTTPVLLPGLRGVAPPGEGAA
eukprot:CAMPEP_0177255688 /NCGR_PEP_ID=MMETSP0367-20130122/56506_1 /TAXON_ID=447022 ORGANISM="Scrippsiella hangoei-like, Strain SHHI-4" /NCGR_SAMPLE_ID=MMETSP0367 /ASSEMBLY_ACC=CAM_ASM_000362 /LENGTH=269 /DNA_ID=CAMNT_0018709451 /DNA_START=8 /DNA_END=817 /DNA_ORIENTATION=-